MFTARNEVAAGNVFTPACDSVHGGGGSLSGRPPGQRPRWTKITLDRDPPGQRSPWTESPWAETPQTETPLNRDSPLDRDPPWTETLPPLEQRPSPPLGQRPSWEEIPQTKDPPPHRRTVMSGWYASYWNAFLFYKII